MARATLAGTRPVGPPCRPPGGETGTRLGPACLAALLLVAACAASTPPARGSASGGAAKAPSGAKQSAVAAPPRTKGDKPRRSAGAARTSSTAVVGAAGGAGPDLESIESELRGAGPSEATCTGLPRAKRRSKDRLIWPVDGVVVSGFGKREGAPHDGIDVAAPVGTPIWAARDGVVLYSGEQPGYGLLVIVRHEGEVVTIYAHNARNCVADGAKVAQGDVIGVVGESGDATSPAVHFEVRISNKTSNPRAHLVD